MRSEFIPIWIANAEYESDAILSQNPIASLSWQQALGICERFQIIAVGQYLLLANLGQFKQNLSRSVDFYLSYLGSAEQRPPTSKVMAFVHAVILDRLSDARTIAQQSRQTWYQGYEYQDDLLFMQCLMALVEQKQPHELESLVQQISTLETDKNAHLIAVCKALSDQNESDFKQAFFDYLDFHFTHYDEMFEKGAILDQDYTLNGSISLTGIALYKLGTSLGFQLEPEYRGVPGLLTQLTP